MGDDENKINSHRPPNPGLSSSELAKIFGEDPSFSTYSESSGAINPLVLEDSKTGEVLYSASATEKAKLSNSKKLSLDQLLNDKEIKKLVNKSSTFSNTIQEMQNSIWSESFSLGLVDNLDDAIYSDYYNILYLGSHWSPRRTIISMAGETTNMLNREEVFNGETPLNQDEYLEVKMNQKAEALLNQSLVNREIDQNTLFKLPRDYDASLSFRKKSKDKTKTIKLTELLKTDSKQGTIDSDNSFDNIMNFICSSLILKNGKFMNYIIHYESLWKEEYKPNFFKLKEAIKSKKC